METPGQRQGISEHFGGLWECLPRSSSHPSPPLGSSGICFCLILWEPQRLCSLSLTRTWWAQAREEALRAADWPALRGSPGAPGCQEAGPGQRSWAQVTTLVSMLPHRGGGHVWAFGSHGIDPHS